jgi:hypothetical protein
MELPCAKCSMTLSGVDPDADWRCYVCGAQNRIRVFPALLRTSPQSSAETASEGEAACFDHPSRRAAGVCAQCGRYVCTVCLVEFGAETLCPSCVAAGSGRARAANLETSRKLWDSTALWLAVLPMWLGPLTLVTAPAALFLSVFRWKAPLSLVRHSRWRFVAAIMISLLLIAAWASLVLTLLLSPTRWRTR